ncbi:MAG: hypothetical protein IK095_07050, partial [Oscillospiraceae bacterium]|nr:hypothetical protein [Oscillospiraceae bacterium]
MMRRRWTALLLAAICLLLCACGSGGARTDQERLTLWCLESDPLCPQLRELVGRYDRDTRGLLPVDLRSFPDEESLAEAFHTARPDLLLCSHDRACALERQGLLRDVRAGLGEEAPACPESLAAAFDQVGRSYFPIGAEVTLLGLSRERAGEIACEDLERLEGLCYSAEAYAARSGRPFFVAASYAEIFYQGMLSRNAEFHADPIRDRRNSAFLRVYSLLTDCAFEGG